LTVDQKLNDNHN